MQRTFQVLFDEDLEIINKVIYVDDSSLMAFLLSARIPRATTTSTNRMSHIFKEDLGLVEDI